MTMLASTTLAALAIDRGGWNHGGPPFGPLVILVPLFWLLVIGALVFALVRRRRFAGAAWGRPTASSPTDAAERVLAERFARGDIEEGEYRLRLEVLRRPAAEH